MNKEVAKLSVEIGLLDGTKHSFEFILDKDCANEAIVAITDLIPQEGLLLFGIKKKPTVVFNDYPLNTIEDIKGTIEKTFNLGYEQLKLKLN